MLIVSAPCCLRVAEESGLGQNTPKVRVTAGDVSPLGRHVSADEAKGAVVQGQPNHDGPFVAHHSHHAHSSRRRLTIKR